MAYAWTGQIDPRFRPAFWFVCLRALFAAFSLLALVLYRVSGKALLDNLRQVFRIAFILGIAALAPKLGFIGVLVGFAVCELLGMVFMFHALAKTFAVFRNRSCDARHCPVGGSSGFDLCHRDSGVPCPVAWTSNRQATRHRETPRSRLCLPDCGLASLGANRLCDGS